MHSILAPLRLIHRELYLLGWGIVPAVLSKFRVECLLTIAGLCMCAASLELIQRRWFAAAVWVVSSGLLAVGMRSDTMLWGTVAGAALGGSAIAAAAAGVLIALGYELKQALREARRERRKYRRIPGTPGAVEAGAPRSRRPRESNRH